MATITANSSGGAWTAGGTWIGGVAPTAADDAVLDASSGNVTISSASVARSLNASAYTGTLTHNAAITLSLGDGTAGAGNAALTLGAGMTYTLGNAATSAINFVSTSATQQTITTAGKTVGNITLSGTTGSWILADDLTSTGTFLCSGGAFNSGNKTITCLSFQMNGATVVGTLGTATFNLTGTTSNLNMFLRTNGASFTMGAATINITTTSTNSRQFAAQATGTSSATLNYTVAGSTGQLLCLPPFDIANLNFSDASNARTLAFTAGSTYTIRNSFNVQGTPGLPMSVVSATGGSTATLSKSSRVVSCNYLSITDITATGGASWYAGANSVNNGNVSGWMFTAPSNYQFLAFV